MKEWTDEWPKEEGFYWFYGWCFGKVDLSEKKIKPILLFVRVIKTTTGFICRIDGPFLYFMTQATGKFREVDLPDLPELT